jgi:hypothetical protein
VVEFVAAGQQVAGESCDHTVESVQLRGQLGDHTVTAQPSGRDHQIRVELVQIPADLGGDPGALDDQIRR